jgi:hypothetical protein
MITNNHIEIKLDDIFTKVDTLSISVFNMDGKLEKFTNGKSFEMITHSVPYNYYELNHDLISRKVNSDLKRIIYDEILMLGDKIYCDLMGESDYCPITKASNISSFIKSKKVIMPIRLTEDLSYTPLFHYNNSSDSLGIIRGSKVYLNEDSCYSHNHILMCDDILISNPYIDINFDDYKSRNLIYKIKFDYMICNPKVLFVLENGFKTGFEYYLSQKRDEKINKILDERN